MAELEKLLVRIGTARDAISRKEEQTSLDYMIDGVLMNCSVMLKEHEAEEIRMAAQFADELEKRDHIIEELKPKTGRWISVPHKKARICNRCEADEPYKFADNDADVYDYCPHCGAKMEG